MEYTIATLPHQDKLNPIRAVYIIKNTISGNCYIGSSADVIRRLRTHISKLRRGIHHSHRFQGAWNKYGEAHFRFLILEVVPPKESLAAKEDAALFRFKPTYNIGQFSADTPMLGRQHRPESLALMSENRKGKGLKTRPPFSDEWKANMSAGKRGKPNPSARRPRTDHEKRNLSGKAKERFSKGRTANPRARAVEIDGIVYQTGADAAIALGISHASVIRWIKAGRGQYLQRTYTGVIRSNRSDRT